MAQNKEYQCVFNQHFNCDYSSPCRNCVNFAPDAAVNKNTSYNKQRSVIMPWAIIGEIVFAVGSICILAYVVVHKFMS